MSVVVRSTYPDIKPVTGKTIPEYIWSNLYSNPHWKNAVCMVCAETGRKYSFQEVHDFSKGFGAGLKNKVGLKPRDVVGILLPNCPQYLVALLGALDAGFVPSLLNPGYKSLELKHLLKLADVRCIITSENFLHTILSLQGEYPGLPLKKIICVDSFDSDEFCRSIFSYENLIREDYTSISFLKGASINTTQETAIIPFSSGTTGLPKGVMLTHSSICTNLAQLGSSVEVLAIKRFSKTGHQERTLGVLPFFHIYGLTVVLLLTVCKGGQIMTVPKFNPNTFAQYARNIMPTIWYLVPPLITFIVNSSEFSEKEFESTHSIVCAAASLGVSLIQKLLKKTVKYICFIEAYGMTELSPGSHFMGSAARNTKLGSIGLLIPSTMARVVDLKTGRDLGPGHSGELWIKGPQVMKGYYKNEKATREIIDENGWLHTGDICRYDKQGYFYIVDRLKEILKCKGFQVAPSELEDVMRIHPHVADVAVIGVVINDEEVPRAYVVKKRDSLTSSDLHLFLEDKVSDFKYLHGGIAFVSSIPRSAAGKTLRKDLLKRYYSELEPLDLQLRRTRKLT